MQPAGCYPVQFSGVDLIVISLLRLLAPIGWLLPAGPRPDQSQDIWNPPNCHDRAKVKRGTGGISHLVQIVLN